MKGLPASISSWGLLLSYALAVSQPAHGQARDEQVPLGQLPQDAAPADSRRPNIVFILTDDQDLHMNSLDYLPHINKHIIEQGTLFKKHFCTTAICCPSRVTLLTGKAAHNTNVTDVSPPYGKESHHYPDICITQKTDYNQADTPSLSTRASTITTSPSSSKTRATIPTTPASYSMPTTSQTTTALFRRAGRAPTSSSTPSPTAISTPRTSATRIRPSATRGSTPPTSLLQRPSASSTTQ